MADSSSSPSPTSLPTSFNISHHFNTPMERQTYSCWKSQFEDVLAIHDLLHVVSTDNMPPNHFLQDQSLNPEYIRWLKTDKLVLSWIKVTVSSSIQILLLPCKSASEAWILLNKRLSPISKVHIRTLRDQLRSLKKTSDKPMAEYLLHAKTLADSLALAGCSRHDSELVEYVLDGLSSEFKEFITSLHLRPTTTFDDLYDLLIQEEHWLKKISSNSTTSGIALAATSNNPPRKQHYNRGRSRGRGRGRGRGHGYSGVYNSDGSRFVNNLPPLLPTPPSVNSSTACQICNRYGHTAGVCPEHGNFAYSTESLADAFSAASISDTIDPNWCLDSGATHHMTPSLSSISQPKSYQGQ